MFRKELDKGESGDNVGILIRNIDKKHLFRGVMLAKPGFLNVSTKIKANIYCLNTE